MVRTWFLDDKNVRPDDRVAGDAHALAERLPSLVQEAARLASALSHGIHGRRRSGMGEDFWQFRPFSSGESAGRIDWRRSAKDGKLYVREREWEAARTIWFWVDLSTSMRFTSDLAMVPKVDRAILLTLALAKVLNEAGERVGLLGLTPPLATRHVIEQFAQALIISATKSELDQTLPLQSVGRRDEIVMLSDFWLPLEEISTSLSRLSGQETGGYMVAINDPIEENFPFDGQAILYERETGLELPIGDADSWRDLYREKLLDFRSNLERLSRSRGWRLMHHRTDKPASETALALIKSLADGSSVNIRPAGNDVT